MLLLYLNKFYYFAIDCLNITSIVLFRIRNKIAILVYSITYKK